MRVVGDALGEQHEPHPGGVDVVQPPEVEDEQRRRFGLGGRDLVLRGGQRIGVELAAQGQLEPVRVGRAVDPQAAAGLAHGSTRTTSRATSSRSRPPWKSVTAVSTPSAISSALAPASEPTSDASRSDPNHPSGLRASVTPSV